MSAFGVAAGHCLVKGCRFAQAPSALPLCFLHYEAFAVSPEYERWISHRTRGDFALASRAVVDFAERVGLSE